MTKKILIVDDSATAIALFKACMKPYSDYTVLSTNKWDSAVEMAVAEKPFLIVLDYNMPEKSGAEIAKLMQSKGVDSKLVLMSANTQNSVVEEVNALGFVDILEKPISAEMLKALLEKLS